jgi:hypothetical protein
MSDLFLTWASNCTNQNISEYLVYFHSLKNKAYGSEVVCLTNNLAPEHEDEIKATGCRVKRLDLPCENVLRDRWLHYWKYLCSTSVDYDCVLISDSRDVLVQGDPFLFLRHAWKSKLIVTSEGFHHSESQWNMVDQFEAQKSVGDFNRNHFFWPVVNGGVVLGRSSFVKNFCFLIWSAVLRTRGACTDQGVINYLMSFLKEDPEYSIADPHNSLLCVTGEGIKQNLLKFKPIFHDGKICNSDGQPFILFHQWDRTNFKEEILSRHGARRILFT